MRMCLSTDFSQISATALRRAELIFPMPAFSDAHRFEARLSDDDLV
jgi:hypothetical protein